MEEERKRVRLDEEVPTSAPPPEPAAVEPQVVPDAAPAPPDTIAYDDFIILYANPESMLPHKVTRGTFVQGAFGMYLSDALVGHPYGQKVYATKGTPGWMYPLRATPELLTSGGLAHRTQLVHSSDVSFVTLALELRAGSVVVESGTGSGSLTNALARIVGNTGHVFTFEFHAERAQHARETFATIGNAPRITVTTRDAYADGFLVDGALGAGGADAVFLDLPQPWLALGHANTVLRGGGMLVNYSPCFEQVEQACALLGQLGFEDVNTVEVRQRPWEMNAVPESAWNVPLEARNAKAPPKQRRSRVGMPSGAVLLAKPAANAPGHTAYLTRARKPLPLPAPQ